MAFIDSITVGNLNIVELDANPTVSGVDAPISSLGVVNDGQSDVYELWQKVGSADTAWLQIFADDLGNHIATEALKMSDFAIENPSRIDYQEDVVKPAHLEGRSFYDKAEYALAMYNDEAEVTHRLGHQGIVRVYNNSGFAIAEGKVTYMSGGETTEGRPTIGLAKADNLTTSKVLGVTNHEIENDSYGYVTMWGNVDNMNLTGFSPGDTVYLSSATPGDVDDTVPVGSSISVPIGYVTKSGIAGSKLMLVTRGVDDPRSSRPSMILSFSSSSAAWIALSSTAYTPVGLFEYAGTAEIFAPTQVTALVGRSSSGITGVRVYDTTNAQVIAEVILSLTGDPISVDLGAVSNLPAGAAVFEFQVSRIGGGGSVLAAGLTMS